MNMVDASTLLTIIFVLVDDWHQQHGSHLMPCVSALPALQPVFSDSEILSLLLAMDYFPYLGEQQFLSSWPEVEEILKDSPWLQHSIDEGISTRASAILAAPK